ncbi:transcription initiation factor IIF, beta subunit-domain-containing protein [Xylariaceae sp. FL0255]|nr:transcription initiation factor IIF, beta subunit-domain-containing protein [Xylariaceae sp. FL0255]
MAAVKPEPMIKQDPDGTAASPAVLSDDDMYEETGDLEFVDLDPNTNPAAGNAYLAHVPKYLYDVCTHYGAESDIQIGTVRKWTETVNGQPKERIAILLDYREPKHQNVPKEYRLDPKDTPMGKDAITPNTFLFTEQDLPGYKSEGRGANNDVPFHIRKQQEQQRQKQQPNDKTQEGGVKKNKWQPRYKKAIAKKTILAARFRHEVNCQPVMTPETQHIMRTMTSDMMKPKVTTTIVKSFDPNGVIQAGAHVSNDKFSNLVRTAPEPKKAKKQKEEKAARLPQSELRDRLFNCFEQFTYWPLKAFKQTLNQPEAWLRENLEELAVLHKSGRFANHWELKPEYKRASAQSLEDAPPIQDAADSDDDDDDNIKMEDVLPS